MTTITKSDIISFAKVLTAIGENIINNPDIILSIVNLEKHSESSEKVTDINISELEKEISSFDFFEKSNQHKFDDIEDYLNKFTPKELSFINRYLKFPYNRSKAKRTLIEDILDQLRKRTESVFRDHG